MQTTENIYFSDLIEHNTKFFASLSPRGHAVASAVSSQLQVWNISSKLISHRFECDCTVDFVKWSPDSELICCGMLKECVQIWNLDMLHFRCKINGCLPFVNIHWAPDSRHLLVISECYIKITMFSLVSSAVTEIENAKAIENGAIFSSCERYLVVAQRINCEDYLSVYSCDTWEAIKTFAVETKDLALISFSPSDLLIAVLESVLECKVLFYSIDGRLLGKYVSETSFCLVSLSWNVTKHLVSVGDCFGEVTILDTYDFEVVASYLHPDSIETSDITLYKVLDNSEANNLPAGVISTLCELDEVVKIRPFMLLSAVDTEKLKVKSLLKSGVQTLEMSFDGRYIASINDSIPKAVFIYAVNLSKLSSVIVRRSSIKSICWHPEKPFLVICSGSNVIDMWTPFSCTRYISLNSSECPIYHAVWSSTGNCILLNSRDNFSVVSFS